MYNLFVIFTIPYIVNHCLFIVFQDCYNCIKTAISHLTIWPANQIVNHLHTISLQDRHSQWSTFCYCLTITVIATKIIIHMLHIQHLRQNAYSSTITIIILLLWTECPINIQFWYYRWFLLKLYSSSAGFLLSLDFLPIFFLFPV